MGTPFNNTKILQLATIRNYDLLFIWDIQWVTLQRGIVISSVFYLYFLQAVNKLQRNWGDMKCQEALNIGHPCWSVAAKRQYIAVGLPNCIKILTKNRYHTRPLCTIGKGQLGTGLYGIAFCDHEAILVSDYDNSNIKMFTIQGRHVRTIDRGSTMFEPLGITVSPDGHIYVCDVANHCVCIFNVNGKFLFAFGSYGSGDEFFNSPRDLCFASDGFLYITDVNNSRICVYDKEGKFIRNFTTTYEPWCIDATDCYLIVNSCLSDKIMIYTTGGDLVRVFGEHGSEFGQFSGPTGVSVASDGLIYIADLYNHRIRVF